MRELSSPNKAVADAEYYIFCGHVFFSKVVFPLTKQYIGDNVCMLLHSMFLWPPFCSELSFPNQAAYLSVLVADGVVLKPF